MKLWKKLLLVIVLGIALFGLYVFLQLRALDVETINQDLFVIRGMGSNVTVLRTDAGAVVIDSMTTVFQGKLIREKVKELTGSEPALIINTHYHLDHTHGNPGFEPGTRIVSTERTLSHLKALDEDFWKGDAAQLLPNETFVDEVSLRIGSQSLKLFHPGRGHTDGDLVVVLNNHNTVVMGDLLFHDHYPNIDLEAGGSVSEWGASLDKVLTHEFNRVIPGHGLTTNRLGIHKFQRFMGQLTNIGTSAAADGTPLEEVLKSDMLTADSGYTQVRLAGISIGLDREFVLRRAWEEATGNFKKRN